MDAVLYVMHTCIDDDIPLNDGCLSVSYWPFAVISDCPIELLRAKQTISEPIAEGTPRPN